MYDALVNKQLKVSGIVGLSGQQQSSEDLVSRERPQAGSPG